MTRRPLHAAGLLLLALLTGCQQEAVPPPAATGAGTTSPTAAPSTAPAAVPGTSTARPPGSTPVPTSAARTFAAGGCLTKEPDWSSVACTTPHEYEVTAVVPDSTHADDMVRRHELRVATCDRQAASYLGNPGLFVTHYRSITFPVAKDGQAASRIVCLVGVFDERFEQVQAVTASMRGRLGGDGVFQQRACDRARVSTATQLVSSSCGAPHASEAVGGGLIGAPGDAFPGPAEVARRTSALCDPMIRAFLGATTRPRTDVAPAQLRPTAFAWARGTRRVSCWVEVTTGAKVVESLRGLGDRPLPAARASS